MGIILDVYLLLILRRYSDMKKYETPVLISVSVPENLDVITMSIYEDSPYSDSVLEY